MAKYLKKTSATGYLRGAENPNLRLQDLPTEKLLCQVCEQLFARDEKVFAAEYFPVLQSDNFTQLRYDEPLYRFVISVAWRILSVQLADILDEESNYADVLTPALENWRLFLLRERKRADTSVHLFVFSGIPKSMPNTMPPKALHYLLRAVDATFYRNSVACGAYVKLVRCCFFIPIRPRELAGMQNTRIHRGGGTLITPQVMRNGSIGGFLTSRMQEAFELRPSETQVTLMGDTLLKDPEKALRSESYAVARASARFGLDE